VVQMCNNPTGSTPFRYRTNGRLFPLEIHLALQSYPAEDLTLLLGRAQTTLGPDISSGCRNESCGAIDPARLFAGCRVREKTTMKNLSDFVNGNGFAVAALILMFAVAIGVFHATIHLAR